MDKQLLVGSKSRRSRHADRVSARAHRIFCRANLRESARPQPFSALLQPEPLFWRGDARCPGRRHRQHQVPRRGCLNGRCTSCWAPWHSASSYFSLPPRRLYQPLYCGAHPAKCGGCGPCSRQRRCSTPAVQKLTQGSISVIWRVRWHDAAACTHQSWRDTRRLSGSRWRSSRTRSVACRGSTWCARLAECVTRCCTKGRVFISHCAVCILTTSSGRSLCCVMGWVPRSSKSILGQTHFLHATTKRSGCGPSSPRQRQLHSPHSPQPPGNALLALIIISSSRQSCTENESRPTGLVGMERLGGTSETTPALIFQMSRRRAQRTYECSRPR